MEVAIALGILISEINDPAFRNRMITFSEDPSWVSFEGCNTLEAKVHVAQHAPWGGSTDIEKALALIEEVVRRGNLREADIPDLIIFSDMQFDEAVGEGDSQTQLERIRGRFHDLGVSLTGSPFRAPRVIFWNLRGDTEGFPATAADENVQMLSGFSPSLFKAVLEGGALEEEVEVVDAETGEKTVTRKRVNPYETLRRVLDDERYFPIREALHESKEGVLAKYVFVKPEPAQDEGVGQPEVKRPRPNESSRGGLRGRAPPRASGVKRG
jgi:hypothetical protein